MEYQAPGGPRFVGLRFFLMAMGTLVFCFSVTGLVLNGSGFASLMRWKFSPAPIELFGVTLPNVMWLWGGLILFVVILIVYLVVAYCAHRAGAGGTDLTGATLQIDQKELAELLNGIQLTDTARALFVNAIIHPARVFERVSESLSPLTRSILVRTSHTFLAPSVAAQAKTRSRHFVIPFLLSPVGRLEDGLRIHSADGSHRLSSLSHLQSVAYTAAAIRATVAKAGRRASRQYRAIQSTNTSVERRVSIFLARSDERDSVSTAEFSAMCRDILLLHTSTGETFLYEAVQVLSALHRSRPLSVQIEVPGSSGSISAVIRVVAERRIIVPFRSVSPVTLWRALAGTGSNARGNHLRFGLMLTKKGLGALIEELRHLLGVASSTIIWPVSEAARARSYHLELKGSASTYMARQGIVDVSGEPIPVAALRRIQISATQGQGQRHSHIYIRDADEDIVNYYYSATYFERTPGSMAISFAAAASALVIVTILAIQQIIQIDQATAISATNSNTADPSGLLQILLAFPVATVAASAFIPDRSMFGGVLASRIAGGLVVLFSLSALVLSSIPSVIDSEALPRLWLFILAPLAVITIATLGSMIMRSAVYRSFKSNSRGPT